MNVDFDNILFIGPNYKNSKGGIASVLSEYQKNIENFNFFPTMLFLSKWLNFIFLPIILFGFIIYLLRNSKIKIIHIHGSFKGSFYRKYCFFFIGKYLFSKKIAYHIHGSEYHLFYQKSSDVSKKYIQKMVNSIDGLIVLSTEWKSFFQDNFHQKNIYILNNIVEFNEFSQKSPSKEKIKFLFLGRIGKRKGVYDILKVVNENKSSFNNKLEIVIGGDGESKELIQKIKEDELENLISYVGWVSGKEKKKLFKKTDVLFLPSYNEGLPISILEGMSYSMPIISTNVGGIPQVLENDINGKMIHPGNIIEMKKALLYYINNKKEVINHGNNSYKRVTPFFPKNVLKALDQIYQKLEN